MFKTLLVASVLVAALPNQTDDQWSYDVENAARAFRIEVYNSFRTNRVEFDRLQDAGFHALDAWKSQGRQPNQAPQMIEWFNDAKDAARAGQASLPQVPEFVSSWTPSKKHLSPRGPIAQETPQFAQQSSPQFDQPTDRPSTEPREPSLVRGLGRALLRTVGVGDSNSSARPAAPQQLLPPPPSNDVTDTVPAEPQSPDNNTADIMASDLEPPKNNPANAAVHQPPASADDLADLIVPETQTSAAEAEAPPAVTTPDIPEIDVDDLKARVDGFNPAISAIGEIVQSEEPVSTDQLSILLEELETLVQSYNDLRPYLTLQSLSKDDRSYVGELVSPGDTIVQLRKRIDDVRQELEATSDSADDSTVSDELSRLDDLLKRVDLLELVQ